MPTTKRLFHVATCKSMPLVLKYSTDVMVSKLRIVDVIVASLQMAKVFNLVQFVEAMVALENVEIKS